MTDKTATKMRLDQLVHERFPTYSRAYIQSLIMQGKVIVHDKIETKPGTIVARDVVIRCDIQEPVYVSRAGFKLEHALKTFGLDVAGFICLDAGLSTGGFTDCLLQHGAEKVYGVDVGYGQVHEKMRNDPRVVVMERQNLRELRSVGELVDLITLDLSFISVLKVMDAVKALLKKNGHLIVLIKPQFESEKHEVGAGGIIRDDALRDRIVDKVVHGIQAAGFSLHGITESPVKGAEGNREFLAYFTPKS